MLNHPSELSVTIASGASLSSAVDLGTKALLGIAMPSSWTAANLTFQGSSDGTTYIDIYDTSGTEKSVTAAASRYIFTTPADFVGIRFLKIRSGTSASAVNQAAERVIKLVTRAV